MIGAADLCSTVARHAGWQRTGKGQVPRESDGVLCPAHACRHTHVPHDAGGTQNMAKRSNDDAVVAALVLYPCKRN